MPRMPTLASLWHPRPPPPPPADSAQAQDDDMPKQISKDTPAVNDSIEASGLRKVVTTAVDRDAHLFHDHPEESRIVNAIANGAVSPRAMNALTRMHRRKGRWHDPQSVSGWEELREERMVRLFRANRDDEYDESVKEDESEGGADDQYCVFQILEMASKDVLMSIVIDQQILERDSARKLPRYKLISALRHSVDRIRGLRNALEERFAHFVALTASARQALAIALCAFYLNREPDLGLFAATQLDRLRFPPVTPIERSRPVFRTRAEILEYIAARDMKKRLDAAMENGGGEETDTIYAITIWAREALNQGQPDNPTTSESGNEHAFSSELFLRQFSAQWTAVRMLSKAIPHLERVGLWKDVEEILCLLRSRQSRCHGDHPGLWPWWSERLAYVYERRLKKPEKALRVLEEAMGDKRTRGGVKVAIIKRMLRLSKPPIRWKNKFKLSSLQALIRAPDPKTITAVPVCNSERGGGGGGGERRGRLVYYDPNNQLCHVERLAEQHYLEVEGWPRVDHAENTILRTLFGLCFWDVIFRPMPDVFQVGKRGSFCEMKTEPSRFDSIKHMLEYNSNWNSEFQSAPLDLSTDLFYPARRAQIDTRLADLQNGLGADIVQRVWDEHYGQRCVGVNWERYTLDDMKDVAKCLGSSGLATICRMFCEEFGTWAGGGIPDLLFWTPSRPSLTGSDHLGTGPRFPACKFVEVKSQNDKLSDVQIAWLQALNNAGMNVEVVKVVNQSSADQGEKENRNPH